MYNYSWLESLLFLPVHSKELQLRAGMKGKTVLITGASSGIGKSIAYRLADTEVHLILTARRGELLDAITEELADRQARISTVQADLRKPEELDKLTSFILQLPEGLDVVVSNAGLSIRRPIRDSLDRFHDFTRTMAINYEAPVQLLLSVIPLLEKSKGTIVNVSSVNVLLPPVPHWAAYQASKSAFDVWLRSADPELNAMGIHVASVYLPLVRTPMILPTAGYSRMPAMHADHVAAIICRMICKRKRKYKPWWLVYGQIASVPLNGLWGRINSLAARN